MHILANFVILMILVILIEKWTFWPLLRTSDSLLSKSPDISAFNPKDPLRTCSKPCYFDPLLTTFGPLWGSWRRLRLGPVRAAFGLEDLLEPQTMPGTQILVILTTFPIEKVNFCHFAQGQWKCHFDPILTPFEPSWAQTFGSRQNVPI